MKVLPPLRAIRENCVECSGDLRKFVAYCPCDGVHSSRCHHWPYRFGLRPDTAAERFGVALITPELMPPANTPLETLPNNPADYGRQMVEAGKAAPVERRHRPAPTVAQLQARADLQRRARRPR